MIDGGLPVCARPGCALRIRNRDHWLIAKPLIQPKELGRIHPAMQRCHVRNCQGTSNEIMQTAPMKMNHIEFTGALQNMVHEQDFARQIIRSTLVLPKRTPAYRNQLGTCD